MAYYHVLLKFYDTDDRVRCIFSDLSEKELLEKFVKHYRKGTDFLCETEVIRTSNIKEAKIICTNQTSEAERSVIQERTFKEVQDFNWNSESVVLISAGRGYVPEDIEEAGTEVTTKYIIGPPGHAHFDLIPKILNNQWVMTIGTGLIIAGIVWLLGWA